MVGKIVIVVLALGALSACEKESGVGFTGIGQEQPVD
jgi:hypothetical protein|tara:strand:- start:2450 stop:2560 length:111 start_codon:yes stop_codon:yes gene_type:complete